MSHEHLGGENLRAGGIPNPRKPGDDQPLEAPPPPPIEPKRSPFHHERERRHSGWRIWTTVGCLSLAATAVTGNSIEDASAYETEKIERVQVMDPVTKLMLESDTPQTRLAIFQKALLNDSCQPKVTPAQVLATSSAIFGTPNIERRLSDQKLAQESANAVKEFNAASENVTFATLPTERIQELSKDAYGQEPRLPMSEYKKVFQDGLAAYGMKPVYWWERGADRTVLKRVHPIKKESFDNSKAARKVIVETLNVLAQEPVELAQLSGVDEVFLGNIVQKHPNDPKYSGMTSSSGDRIYLDITPQGTVSLMPGKSTTFSHEQEHQLQFEECEDGNGNVVPDKAFAALSGGFAFDEKAADSLQTNPNFGPFTRMDALSEDDKQEAVVVRSYGASDLLEAGATLIGEYVFFPPNQPKLFDSQENSLLLYNQIALCLTRLKASHPELGLFYEKSLRLARFVAEAQRREDAAHEAVNWQELDGSSVAYSVERAQFHSSLEQHLERHQILGDHS